MDNKQYNEYCRLQDAIRKAGFRQLFDKNLATCIKHNDPHFTICCQIADEDFRVRFDLNFYKLDGSDEYTFDHYKGTYRREIHIPEKTINNVNTAALENRMRMINWNVVRLSEDLGIMEPSTEKLISIINGIMEDLQKLTVTEEGKVTNCLLQAKYLSNTFYIQNTSLQKLYDAVDEPYNTTMIFPARGRIALTLDKAALILNGSMPPPLLQHEVYQVFTDGIELRGSSNVKMGDYFQEIKFFSSLEKAVSHIQAIDERSFLPLDALIHNQQRIVRQAQIIDDINKVQIALKSGNGMPSSIGTPDFETISWEINTSAISVQDFEKKTGLALSKFGSGNGKDNSFQVYPPLPADEKKVQQQPPKRIQKHRPPGKKPGQSI